MLKTRRTSEDPEVPLVLPDVNGEHLALIDTQRAIALDRAIVTNANCAATVAAVALGGPIKVRAEQSF